MDDAEQSARRYIEACIYMQGGERPAPEAVEKAVQQVARVTRKWQKAIAQQQKRYGGPREEA